MKNNKSLQTITVYLYHLVLIIAAFFLMKHYVDVFLTIALALSVLFLIFWFWLSWKKYTAWTVYLNFFAGCVIQSFLHYFEVIPHDTGFFPGLGTAIYIMYLGIHLGLIGFINLCFWLVYRIKQSRRNIH